MEPGSENYDKQTNGEGASTPQIKAEYGNNVEIKLEMAMAKKTKVLRKQVLV